MTNDIMIAYGLTAQYASLAQAYGPQYEAARILSQEKGLYRLICARGEQTGAVSGRLRYNARSAADFPAVGDFVAIESSYQNGSAVIHEVLPRKSVFIRKAAGTGHAEQVVAANVDTLFICMSLNNDFNLKRLERYLSVAWESGATPVVVLTKADLCADVQRCMRDVASVAVGVDIVLTSALAQDGYAKLLPFLQPGRTVALIGSSGVGKSTLVNRLLGEDRLNTNGLRDDDKGRHTTTRRALFLLTQGGMVIDTPGMRELGLWDSDEGLDRAFSDIEALAKKCRFRDCSHTNEPRCAVREALQSGLLSEERLLSYRKLRNENRYSEDAKGYMSEKREKFKNIALANKAAGRKQK